MASNADVENACDVEHQFRSVESLNVSDFHGCTSYSGHARTTVAFPTPRRAPSNRDDRWVAPHFFGGGTNLAATISA